MLACPSSTRAAASRMAALAVAAILSLPFAARAQTPTPTPTPAPYASDERPLFVPQPSVADPDGADAIVFNPAALKMESGGDMVYIHADGRDRTDPRAGPGGCRAACR